MKILVLGATGTVGQGALLECLDDKDVHQVVSVVRRVVKERGPSRVLESIDINTCGAASFIGAAA